MLEAVLAFLAGLLIGSFLNVCVYRLPRDLSVVRPRSHCPACENQIDWYDNIPVLSYLILGGRCRHCRERISLRYPVVELATASAFALCVTKLGLTWPAAKFSILSAILITLIATDLEERILPDEFTLGGTVLGIALSGVVPLDPGIASFLLFGTIGQRWLSVVESLTGAFVASGLIWGFAWLYGKIRKREVLGLGDVKMIAMLGAFLGLEEALLILCVAGFVGSLVGVIYIVAAKKDWSTYELPYGSFIGAAGLAIALWAQVLRAH
ncbi:MAG: prepilin peptidase [Acidobacteriia bacterium]|nr:prepilin peptidase [Terriglobia bacterium]